MNARIRMLAMLGLATAFGTEVVRSQQPGGGQEKDEQDHAADEHARPAAEEYPFEWGGVFPLPRGPVTLRLRPGPDDASMNVVLIAIGGADVAAFEAAFAEARQAFARTPKPVASGASLAADGSLHQLQLLPTPMHYTIVVPAPACYALFTEHMPWEFRATLEAEAAAVAPIHVRQFRTQEARLTAVAVKTSGLRTGKVVKRRLITSVVVPARVSFNEEAMAHVGSPLVGWVTEIKVRLGDRVTPDQPLLVIESPELGEAQSDYLLKRTTAEAAVPAVDLARNAFERADALYRNSRGLSLTEVQRRELEYRAAQAVQRSAEAAMAAARNRLHLLGMSRDSVQKLVETGEISPHYTRTAPIAGTVVEREVTLGELVNPDKEALLVLTDMSTLWVLADVPEARMREVHVGARAVVNAVGSAVAEIEGTVSYISPIVDLTTRTAQVRIVVAGSASGLRAGMFARVDITSTADDGGAPVLAIPEEAVQRIDGQTCVFVPVEGEDNTFAKRLVLIGDPIGGMVPVRSGLGEGEAVVVANSFILKAELGKAGAQHEH